MASRCYLRCRNYWLWITLIALTLVNGILLLCFSSSNTVADKSSLKNKVSVKSGYKLADFVRKQCLIYTEQIDRRFQTRISVLLRRMHLIQKQLSLYCPVEKVGTTFWRRVIYQTNHTEVIRHPYHVTIRKALTQQFQHPDKKSTITDYEDYFKFFFVRDPYHRILSAFIDKLFAPNPVFWERLGSKSIKRDKSIKRSRMSDVRHCFHNATFSEFIQNFVLSVKYTAQSDPHISLASQMCIPCTLPYNYIGKMESFKDDIIPVFKRLQLNHSVPILKRSLKEMSDLDAIEDSIFSPYSWQSKILDCMTWEEALLRIWRKLQMRGLIDMDKKFPFKDKDVSALTKEHVLEMATKAYRESDPDKLQLQRQEVFINMYRTLPQNILENVKHVYKEDFRLFDYDPSPQELFNQSFAFSLNDFENFRN